MSDNLTNPIDSTESTNQDSQSIIIEYAKLKALINAASKDATRPHLQGVSIRQGYMFATDGYILSFDKDDRYLPFDGFHVSLEMFKNLPKVDLELSRISENEFMLDRDFVKTRVPSVSNTPNPAHIIPSQDYTPTIEQVYFNPDLFTKCVKASVHLKKKGNKCHIVYGSDVLSPLSLYVNNEFSGVIMPMRGN